MLSVNEMFYGENEPTWIVRHFGQEVPPYSCYMVPSIELRVPMCCIRCEIKVKNQLTRIRGVHVVICDLWNQKVTVTGNVHPAKILKETRRVKKRAEFWASGY